MQNGRIDLDQVMFSIENIESIKNEIMSLAHLHYDSIESDLIKDNVLDPDWERYAHLENNNSLIIFTAREKGVLIGYNVFFVHTSIHYKSLMMANQDLIFIHPDKRGFGKYFIFYSDEKLKEIGVKKVFYHLKAKNDWSDKILKPMGYELMDKIYGRNL